MITINHLTKIYNAKGGVATRALDDVSISFGETGMVFLLGKSGSGKSTLLNICGGLDEPTEGEVIIKGKSSKEFSGSDFDSYRNTFVGFIFQEYNILDEFNVEDNIALALELQGKPKDKEKIASLLDEVELASYAKRKPNTLSGGQKQRIAIARALVKDPQIIMADEPTGALDSATGKQVFDTLKKLSKTRLVIVVSHDREFAEFYGDRIVELKDGKIISDVTKTHVAPESIDDNVSVIGGNTLTIRHGATLTEKNFEEIRKFIASAQKDVIISHGEQEITAFKKAARITDDGRTERFDDTRNVALKEYDGKDCTFIRSRLPAAKAMKIGASGLKLKPVRLVFTILLSFIAFTLFGLLSTLMVYDGNAVLTQSLLDSDYDYLNIQKRYVSRQYYGSPGDYIEYLQSDSASFTPAEIAALDEQYHGAIGYYKSNYDYIENIKINANEHTTEYYTPTINKFAEVPAASTMRSKLLVGDYPVEADEICISNYLVNAIKWSKFYEVVETDGKLQVDDTRTYTVKSDKDAVGKYIYLGNTAFKITGVFDSGELPAKYDELKERDAVNTGMLQYEFNQFKSAGLYYVAFVSDNFYNSHSNILQIKDEVQYFKYADASLTLKYTYCKYNLVQNGDGTVTVEELPAESDKTINQSSEVRSFEEFTSTPSLYTALPLYYVGGNAKTSLADDEVIVNAKALDSVYDYLYGAKLKALLGDLSQPMDAQKAYDAMDQVMREADTLQDTLMIALRGEHYDNASGDFEYATIAQIEQARKEVIDYIENLDEIDITLAVDDVLQDFRIVGFYFPDAGDWYSVWSDGVLLSQSFIDKSFTFKDYAIGKYGETNYVPPIDGVYGGAFVAFDKKAATVDKITARLGVENADENDVFFNLNNPVYDSVRSANSMAENLSAVFLYAGIAFAVFAALLMFNFISMSISNKRKEIGVLRAVGARGLDVFKIFFAESGIIVLICTVLSLIGTAVLCGVLNSVFAKTIGLTVSMLVFGPLTVLMMVGIALLVSLISTFLPVYFAARKKPVDSIRAL